MHERQKVWGRNLPMFQWEFFHSKAEQLAYAKYVLHSLFLRSIMKNVKYRRLRHLKYLLQLNWNLSSQSFRTILFQSTCKQTSFTRWNYKNDDIYKQMKKIKKRSPKLRRTEDATCLSQDTLSDYFKQQWKKLSVWLTTSSLSSGVSWAELLSSSFLTDLSYKSLTMNEG